MVKKRFKGKLIVKPCESSSKCLFIEGYKKPLEEIIKESIEKIGSITSISYKVEPNDNNEVTPFEDNLDGTSLNRILKELKSYPGRFCTLEVNFSMISDKY